MLKLNYILGLIISGLILFGISFADCDCYECDKCRAVQSQSIKQFEDRLKEIIEKEDYYKFKVLFDGQEILKKINSKAKFLDFVQMHRYFLQGKYNLGEEIRKKLGLPEDYKNSSKVKNNTDKLNKFDSDKLKKSIKNKDFELFQEAVGNSIIGEKIDTKDKFNEFVKMNNYFDKVIALQNLLNVPSILILDNTNKEIYRNVSINKLSEAVRNNDYKLFKNVVRNSIIGEKIDTKDKFNDYVKMNDYIAKGLTIEKNLGLPSKSSLKR